MTQGPNDWDFRVFSQKYTFGIDFVLAPSAEDTAVNSVLATVELLFQSTVLRMVEISILFKLEPLPTLEIMAPITSERKWRRF